MSAYRRSSVANRTQPLRGLAANVLGSDCHFGFKSVIASKETVKCALPYLLSFTQFNNKMHK